MVLEDAKIVKHDEMGEPQFGIRRLVLKTQIASEAEPGQFVHIKVSPGLDPLLRRPISIAGIDPEKKEITLLYRLCGKGTEVLAQAKPGDFLNLMGPLGHGFTVPQEGTLHLVAGGIGGFPLLSLAKKALERGVDVRFYWGGESRSSLESAGLNLWEELGIAIEVSTLDGSLGVQGTVLDLLRKCTSFSVGKGSSPSGAESGSLDRIAVCGPQAMMEAVSTFFAETGFEVEVSLEERMGCGVGACLGCVCTLRDGQGKLRRGKVCKDGPVFKAAEVVWHEVL